ncbi:hypothetical protein [Empedobacter sp.]|uniref:hypothetical protein n=1 Tax=Empedobacter sp. TaxID=1927715 RepID=UPI0028A7FE30|nr:hypothetical protein [Empedobacter sp.]
MNNFFNNFYKNNKDKSPNSTENTDIKIENVFKNLSQNSINKIINIIMSENSELDRSTLKDFLDKDSIAYFLSLELDLYNFKNLIKNTFFRSLKNSENSLNTAEFIALLLGTKNKFEESDNKKLKPIFDYLLDFINEKLIQSIAILKTQLQQNNYSNLQRGIYSFFILDKKHAINNLKKLIIKDQIERRELEFMLDYSSVVDSIFNKMEIDFIPNINNQNYLNKIQNSIVQSTLKSEIKEFIDFKDYFNNKIPLIKFEITDLISPQKNISDLNNFKKLHCNLFRKYDHNFDENILDIYYDCIFGLNSYAPHDYINCREELINKINDYDISSDFIANYNYCYKNDILNFNQIKLSKILNSFFMDIKGFKISILRRDLSSEEFLINYLPNIENFLNSKE